MADKAPLVFAARLGGLFPANMAAEAAMREIRGKVTIKGISGGTPNQRRRSLYWVCAGIVVGLLNEAHNLTLDETDLHDLTRDKLRMFDEIRLPSGDTLRKRHSTSNRAMNEAERAAFTDKALHLWATWTGVDPTMIRTEAERLAA